MVLYRPQIHSSPISDRYHSTLTIKDPPFRPCDTQLLTSASIPKSSTLYSGNPWSLKLKSLWMSKKHTSVVLPLYSLPVTSGYFKDFSRSFDNQAHLTGTTKSSQTTQSIYLLCSSLCLFMSLFLGGAALCRGSSCDHEFASHRFWPLILVVLLHWPHNLGLNYRTV